MSFLICQKPESRSTIFAKIQSKMCPFFYLIIIFSDDQTVITHFETTPPTSTYLIGIYMSDFEYVTNVNRIV